MAEAVIEEVRKTEALRSGYCLVKVEDVVFAVPANQIREFSRDPVTPIANMPAHVKGIVSPHLGQTVCVVDLRELLGSPEAGGDIRPVILILDGAWGGRPPIRGLVVDQVLFREAGSTDAMLLDLDQIMVGS